MLTNILSLIHNATTLLFGVYASAAFLGVRLNRKNNLHLLIFSVSQALFMHFLFCYMEHHLPNRYIL